MDLCKDIFVIFSLADNVCVYKPRPKPGRKAGSSCTGGHHLGPGRVAIIQSRGVAAKPGFLMYFTKGDAIGTKVSVRYRESGRLSGVVVKRGSTVYKPGK